MQSVPTRSMDFPRLTLASSSIPGVKNESLSMAYVGVPALF